MFEQWDTLQRWTQDWILLESPLKITIISVIYLLVIYVFGPRYMKNRPPYSLKAVLAGYNIFQIIISFVLAKEFFTHGVSVTQIYKCQMPDYSNSPENIYRARIMYYSFLLKIVELIETVFFVLRKKQNQISKLHVYHHISTIYLTYFGVKFVGCGLGCLSLVLNLIVHFFMYTYYLLSSFLDEKGNQRMLFYKIALTKIQIIQFLIIIVNIIMSLSCADDISLVGFWLILPDVLILLYMFVQFYIKTYFKKPATPSTKDSGAKKVLTTSSVTYNGSLIKLVEFTAYNTTDFHINMTVYGYDRPPEYVKTKSTLYHELSKLDRLFDSTLNSNSISNNNNNNNILNVHTNYNNDNGSDFTNGTDYDSNIDELFNVLATMKFKHFNLSITNDRLIPIYNQYNEKLLTNNNNSVKNDTPNDGMDDIDPFFIQTLTFLLHTKQNYFNFWHNKNETSSASSLVMVPPLSRVNINCVYLIYSLIFFMIL